MHSKSITDLAIEDIRRAEYKRNTVWPSRLNTFRRVIFNPDDYNLSNGSRKWIKANQTRLIAILTAHKLTN